MKQQLICISRHRLCLKILLRINVLMPGPYLVYTLLNVRLPILSRYTMNKVLRHIILSIYASSQTNLPVSQIYLWQILLSPKRTRRRTIWEGLQFQFLVLKNLPMNTKQKVMTIVLFWFSLWVTVLPKLLPSICMNVSVKSSGAIRPVNS